MIEFEILPNRRTIWHGTKGRDFALRIGREHRHRLGRFIIRNTRNLPVKVLILRLERRREYSICPITLNGARKVGFTHRKYFIVADLDDVVENIRCFLSKIVSSVNSG